MTPVHVASEVAIEAFRVVLDQHRYYPHPLVSGHTAPSSVAPWRCLCGVESYNWHDRQVHLATALAYAVDAPDESDLAARVIDLANHLEGRKTPADWDEVGRRLRALVSEPTDPTLRDRLQALADEWERDYPYTLRARMTADLRAALADHDTTGEPQ